MQQYVAVLLIPLNGTSVHPGNHNSIFSGCPDCLLISIYIPLGEETGKVSSSKVTTKGSCPRTQYINPSHGLHPDK